jgi:DNA-binding LacI/PurR family transcriptional regulator
MKHRHLREQLEDAIRSGSYAPGARLPGERELSERYQVSRITVRSALAAMVTEGLIERRHGSGTYVRDRPEQPNLVVVHQRVVAPKATDWFMSELVSGLEQALSQAGRHLTWVAVQESGSLRQHLHRVGIQLRPGLPVLLSGFTPSDEDVRDLRGAGCHLVTISEPSCHEPLIALGADHFEAARLATRHLLDHGRRRVLLLNGPYSLNMDRQRLAGWKQAHQDAGIPCDESLAVETVDWDLQYGQRIGREIIAGRHACDAVLSYGDWFTHGLLASLAASRIRIPDDIALIAGDGYAWMRNASPLPTLTYLLESRERLGQAALHAFDDLGRGHQPTGIEQRRIAVDFVRGTTCGCRIS